jgi:hypothetical protein
VGVDQLARQQDAWCVAAVSEVTGSLL